METPRRDQLRVCIHTNLFNSVMSPLLATLVPTVTSVWVATSPYTTGLTALNVTTRLATILAIAIVPLVIRELGRGAHQEVISVRIEAGNGEHHWQLGMIRRMRPDWRRQAIKT